MELTMYIGMGIEPIEKPSDLALPIQHAKLGILSSTTGSRAKTQQPVPPATHSSNPFTKLAKELVCEILLHLPYPSLQNFALSGLTPFNLPSISSFWKRKLAIDMPFLWDLPALPGSRDWFAIYHEMRRHCFATTPATRTDEEFNTHVVGDRDPSIVLGLANRRRVWNCCDQLVELYVKGLSESQRDDLEDRIDPDIVSSSISLQMPVVAAPVGKEVKSVSAYLLSRWEGLEGGMGLRFWFAREDG